MNYITLCCYWGGKTYEGPNGVTYDKAVNKAIKVDRGIQFDELLDRIYRVSSFDKQQHKVNVICRYPSVRVGKEIKYIPLPIKHNDDVDIMFDVFTKHQEVNSIDIYLEGEDNPPIRNNEMTSRNHDSVVLEERSTELVLTNTSNAISDMIHNDDFFSISEVAVVTNAMDIDNEVELNEGLEDGIGDEDEDEDVEVDEAPSTFTRGETSFGNVQVPSTFTSLEGTNMTCDSN